MVALAAESDVFSVIASGSVPNAGRLCASALDSGDVFELDCHGFSLDEPLRFRPEEGGGLPSPLVAGTTYYALPVDEARFSVSATAGGSAIPLTSDGSLVVVLRDRPVAWAIAMASDYVSPALRGNVEPASLLEVPHQVRSLVALYAARILRVWSQREHADLAPLIIDAEKRLDKWMRGVPTGGADATGPANLAVSRSGTRAAGGLTYTRGSEPLP